MSRIPLATVLADFDSHVAKMRARIAAGSCRATWSEDGSGEMLARVILDGKAIAEVGTRYEDGEGPE